MAAAAAAVSSAHHGFSWLESASRCGVAWGIDRERDVDGLLGVLGGGVMGGLEGAVTGDVGREGEVEWEVEVGEEDFVLVLVLVVLVVLVLLGRLRLKTRAVKAMKM